MTSLFHIKPGGIITGDITVCGDKSISHRAIILSSIANGVVEISNCCLGDDVLNTINVMRELGVEINLQNAMCEIHGVGLHGLKPSQNPLNCGNSGTTMRLLSGLLCAQKFNSVLIGDESLTRRPMLRVAEPLRLMGAKINLTDNSTAPIEIIGEQKLQAIDYELLIPSAQVKSAVLLAGLYAPFETRVREKTPTRDHTERLLTYFGNIKIPGDISSAAFFIVLAAITPSSNLIIRQVGVNPFRTGIIDILKLMGADIELSNHQFFGLEPVADIRVTYAPLHGIEIPNAFVTKAIDEFPAIFIAAATASGNTILRGAKELRVKESDRIKTMCEELKNVGVKTQEYDDGVLIFGDQEFQGGRVNSGGDHRIAMAFAIAGNVAQDEMMIDNCELVKTSFPNFMELANQAGLNICP